MMSKSTLQELRKVHERQYCDQVIEFLSMLQEAQNFLGQSKFKEWERNALGWLIELVEAEKYRQES